MRKMLRSWFRWIYGYVVGWFVPADRAVCGSCNCRDADILVVTYSHPPSWMYSCDGCVPEILGTRLTSALKELVGFVPLDEAEGWIAAVGEDG